MGSYRKRPVVVEAVRFTPAGFVDGHGEALPDAPSWLRAANESGVIETIGDPVVGISHLVLRDLNGLRVEPGDWVIRGVEGELYGCKDSVFRATYDEVLEGGQGFTGSGHLQSGSMLGSIKKAEAKQREIDPYDSTGAGSAYLGDVSKPLSISEAVKKASARGREEQCGRQASSTAASEALDKDVEAKERHERAIDFLTGRTQTPSTAAFETDKSQLNTGVAGNAPKEPVTKWSVTVSLALGSGVAFVTMQFSSYSIATVTVDTICKAMEAHFSTGAAPTPVSFPHDRGEAVFFANDVRAIQKTEFKDYGYGDDL